MAKDNNKKKTKRQSPRILVPLDQSSGPSRYFIRMQRDIHSDLGGRGDLSRIEQELVRGFCGCATRLEYLTYQILLGADAECDIASYANLASTMLRIGSRLGFSRRARDVTPSLKDIVGDYVDTSAEEAT
jgi:hypothetical protein